MISLKPLFELAADVAEPQVIPDAPCGTRRFIPITGGTFKGERLSGKMLAGGADCQLIRPDGVAELDVRVTFQTHDQVNFLMRGLGIRHGPDDVLARIARGEDVDPSQYYFRQSMTFEAPQGPYDWLNRIIAIGTGMRRANQVIIRVFEVC